MVKYSGTVVMCQSYVSGGIQESGKDEDKEPCYRHCELDSSRSNYKVKSQKLEETKLCSRRIHSPKEERGRGMRWAR
jgi:hypothetical protein